MCVLVQLQRDEPLRGVGSCANAGLVWCWYEESDCRVVFVFGSVDVGAVHNVLRPPSAMVMVMALTSVHVVLSCAYISHLACVSTCVEHEKRQRAGAHSHPSACEASNARIVGESPHPSPILSHHLLHTHTRHHDRTQRCLFCRTPMKSPQSPPLVAVVAVVVIVQPTLSSSCDGLCSQRRTIQKSASLVAQMVQSSSKPFG